jgi:hypothetical protein
MEGALQEGEARKKGLQDCTMTNASEIMPMAIKDDLLAQQYEADLSKEE